MIITYHIVIPLSLYLGGKNNTVIPVDIPANTKHLYNIYTMLDQRRRRWDDVV